MYSINALFDLSHTLASEYLKKIGEPHLALSELRRMILEIGASLSPKEYRRVGENIYISRSALISDGAEIGERCIIGHGCEIRKGAFIRGDCIIGNETVVGNSTEIKNSIIFDGCQIPHFNYVGDSILGYRAHFGAGAIASNLRSDKKSVKIRADGKEIDTGLRKLGALVGDFAEIGCNSVLCPGCVIGRGASVYPLSLVRGYIAEGSVFKGERSK